MAKTNNKKKSSQTQTALVSPWMTNWPNFDQVFDNLRKDFERAFLQFPLNAHMSLPKLDVSSCDLIDEGKEYHLKANFPGVKKKDIDLNITENSVDISAEYKEKFEKKKKNFLRKERREGSYHRVISLPEKIQVDRSKAKLQDGILNVVLPKVTPTPKAKKKSLTIE